MKYYDLDTFAFALEKTSSGYYLLKTYDKGHDSSITHMFSTELDALREIVSYAETDDLEI